MHSRSSSSRYPMHLVWPCCAKVCYVLCGDGLWPTMTTRSDPTTPDF